MLTSAEQTQVWRTFPGALLLVTVLFGMYLRLYGLDWGTDGAGRFHPLHPDETTLITATSQLRDQLKPAITAYGTLPMYLLYLIGKPVTLLFGTSLFDAQDQAFTYVFARTLSATFSIFTIYLVFKIGRRTDDDWVGLLGAAFLAVMVLPIQLAHFYTVDGLFTAIATLAVYHIIRTQQRDSWNEVIVVGILTGLATGVRLGGFSYWCLSP